jgi:hypothetical protein
MQGRFFIRIKVSILRFRERTVQYSPWAPWRSGYAQVCKRNQNTLSQQLILLNLRVEIGHVGQDKLPIRCK